MAFQENNDYEINTSGLGVWVGVKLEKKNSIKKCIYSPSCFVLVPTNRTLNTKAVLCSVWKYLLFLNYSLFLIHFSLKCELCKCNFFLEIWSCSTTILLQCTVHIHNVYIHLISQISDLYPMLVPFWKKMDVPLILLCNKYFFLF